MTNQTSRLGRVGSVCGLLGKPVGEEGREHTQKILCTYAEPSHLLSPQRQQDARSFSIRVKTCLFHAVRLFNMDGSWFLPTAAEGGVLPLVLRWRELRKTGTQRMVPRVWSRPRRESLGSCIKELALDRVVSDARPRILQPKQGRWLRAEEAGSRVNRARWVAATGGLLAAAVSNGY